MTEGHNKKKLKNLKSKVFTVKVLVKGKDVELQIDDTSPPSSKPSDKRISECYHVPARRSPQTPEEVQQAQVAASQAQQIRPQAQVAVSALPVRRTVDRPAPVQNRCVPDVAFPLISSLPRTPQSPIHSGGGHLQPLPRPRIPHSRGRGR